VAKCGRIWYAFVLYTMVQLQALGTRRKQGSVQRFMATMSRYFAAFDVSLIVSVHPYYIPYYITHEIKSRKVTQSEYGELASNTPEGGNFEREPAEVWNLSVGGGTVCMFTGNQWNDLAPVFYLSVLM
jgi:hypothetical protein